jgi:hypothetical protein
MMQFLKDLLLNLKNILLSVIYFLNFITLITIFYFMVDNSTYKIISSYSIIENNSFLYLFLLFCVNLILFSKKLNHLLFRLVALPFTAGILVIFKLFYIEYNKLDTLNLTHWVGVKRVWTFSELHAELENLLSVSNINIPKHEQMKVLSHNDTMSSIRSYVAELKLERTREYEKLLNEELLAISGDTSSFSIVKHITDNGTFYAVGTVVLVAACVGLYFYMSGGSPDSGGSPASTDSSVAVGGANVSIDATGAVGNSLSGEASDVGSELIKKDVSYLISGFTLLVKRIERLDAAVAKRVELLERNFRGMCGYLKKEHSLISKNSDSINELEGRLSSVQHNLEERLDIVQHDLDSTEEGVTELLTMANTDAYKKINAQNEVSTMYEGKLNAATRLIEDELDELSENIVDVSTKLDTRVYGVEQGITALLVYLFSNGVIPEEASSFSAFVKLAEDIDKGGSSLEPGTGESGSNLK